jgi:hypothetical protein
MTRQNVADPKPAEKPGGRRKRGHRFFLNPYEDAAFTRCPKCDRKTMIRKFPLVIHIEPGQLFVLNKQCRYCLDCDLIIARRSELEKLIAGTFENRKPDIIGNDYLVMGTVTRPTWRTQRAVATHPADLLDQTQVSRDVWNFKLLGSWQVRA